MDENMIQYDFLITASRMFAEEAGTRNLINIEVEIEYLDKTLRYTLPLLSSSQSIDELQLCVMRDIETEDIKSYVHKTINNLLYLQQNLIDTNPQSWGNYTRFVDNFMLGNYD